MRTLSEVVSPQFWRKLKHHTTRMIELGILIRWNRLRWLGSKSKSATKSPTLLLTTVVKLLRLMLSSKKLQSSTRVILQRFKMAKPVAIRSLKLLSAEALYAYNLLMSVTLNTWQEVLTIERIQSSTDIRAQWVMPSLKSPQTLVVKRLKGSSSKARRWLQMDTRL